MLKTKCLLVIIILLTVLLSPFFHITAFAQDLPNTKVVITGDWIDLEDAETVVVLTNSTTGKVYNGILKYNKQLIFKNIDYGTYTITCENPLNIEYVGSSLTGDTFTLTQNETEQVVESITITNKVKNLGGFYSTTESNSPIKQTIPSDILSITLTEIGVSEVDGQIVSEIVDGVPIPTGFYYVGGSKETGIVISDNSEDSNKGDSHNISATLVGNQFVWIPASTGASKLKVAIDPGPSGEAIRKWAIGVHDLDYFKSDGNTFTEDTLTVESGQTYSVYAKNNKGKEIVETITITKSIYNQTNNMGQLYDFSGGISSEIAYTLTGNREPSISTGYDGTTLDPIGITSILLQSEFKDMIESVKMYGGFYVGRYETGNLSAATVESKAGNTDIGNQNWYTMYMKQKNLYSTRTNVTSSMIWGSQYDAIMNWMLSSNDTGISTFVTDSTGKGNYIISDGGTGSIAKTGSNQNYKVNNIYDLGGNVYESTLESRDSNRRISRGRKLSYWCICC